MIRILVFLALLGLLVLGFGWVADQPGDVAVTFRDTRYETSPVVALVAVIALAFAATLLFGVFSWLVRAPRRWRLARRARQRDKGIDALSRGMVAAGAGDLRRAQRATDEAVRRLGEQPLTLLLEAQTAMLSGDRDASERTFARIAAHPETRVLGLRGLHAEARRRGDTEAAHAYADEANRIAPLPWAGQAVLEHHAMRGDWAKALDAVDANLSQKLIDKTEAKRQRATLRTAMALELAERDPEAALAHATDAVALAPTLAPAVALAARLLGKRGDLRKASRMIELVWRHEPQPALAEVYLSLRPGDSAADRQRRAETLAKLAPNAPESRMAVARAAVAARDFGTAREAMAPLVGPEAAQRPTRRMCALMAELEEAEGGPAGVVREWLARAARAPHDKAWVADGVISDTWSAISPVTGKLDAWRWETPPERLAPLEEPIAPEPPPPLEAVIAAPAPPPAGVTKLPPAALPDDPGPRG